MRAMRAMRASVLILIKWDVSQNDNSVLYIVLQMGNGLLRFL